MDLALAGSHTSLFNLFAQGLHRFVHDVLDVLFQLRLVVRLMRDAAATILFLLQEAEPFIEIGFGL
ncbi:hypothetical protein [Sagittula stellata]|uniref:Uncharacterized protein n=1 Tax=Sagittula stellata (strain ATCC 700073 / DSM 11524 / E-37) TaxID=388399 RepID=A3K009_SAGS3|nr:hypothetical protein [Sagittula stellata]EBA09124.1 hypothetical protein SSE37_22819 [Sagittula stellata E-37]